MKRSPPRTKGQRAVTPEKQIENQGENNFLCTSRLALQDEQSFRLFNPRKGCFVCLQACEDGDDVYTVARGPPFEPHPRRIVLPRSFQRAIDLPTESTSSLSFVLTGRLLLSLAGYRHDLIEHVRDMSIRGYDKRTNVACTSFYNVIDVSSVLTAYLHVVPCSPTVPVQGLEISTLVEKIF
jgi:hypothetical protein